MIPKVRVPANFGRELINSPVHGNLVLNLRDGSVLRVNSVIMSLNSPVIGNFTTNLCQSSHEMDDFSVEAVHCFVDAMYSGESEMLNRLNFEDVNKMAHVFEVSWFRKKCLKFFKTDVLNFENNSYEEILFACEIASRAYFNLKQSKFVDLFVRNMTTRNIGKRVFLRKYMSNFDELSKRQINMAVQIAGRELNIVFDCLVSYLTFGLKYTGFDENSLYLLEQVDMRLFQQRYPDQFVEVVDLITELSGGSEGGQVKELVEKVVKLRSEVVAGGSDEVLEDSKCSGDSEESDDEDLLEGCRHVATQTEEAKTGPYRYTREEMIDKIVPDLPLSYYYPKSYCIMDSPILPNFVQEEPPMPRELFVPSWQIRNGKMVMTDRDPMAFTVKHTRALIQTHKKNPNAWLSKRKRKNDPGELRDLKMLRGNILGTLNKITPQNFKDLSVQILQLGIDNMKKLEIAVEIIFEKAVLEPLYSETYAIVCKIMGSIKFPEEQNSKVSPFRKTLLNRCQKEFFREKSDEDKLNKKMDELQARTDLAENEKQAQMEELLYQRSKLKKKMLGNINFIGELFNLGMLSSKIILSQCIGNMLAKRAQGKLHDEVVECLAKLFSTVGLKLENDCDDELKKRAFEKSFGDFKEFGSNSNYAYRIRFMIQDVVELRDNNWVPRRKMEAAVASSSRESKSRADLPNERGAPRYSRFSSPYSRNETPQRFGKSFNLELEYIQDSDDGY